MPGRAVKLTKNDKTNMFQNAFKKDQLSGKNNSFARTTPANYC